MIVKDVEQVADEALTQDVYCYVPETLDLEAILPEPLQRYTDQARWFIGTILWKLARMNNVRGKKTYMRLMAKHLKRIMGDKYEEIVNALLDRDVVQRTPYTPGVCSFGYKLHTRYDGVRLVRVRLRNHFLLKHIRRWQQEIKTRQETRMEPVHFALREQQLRLEMDMEEAERILNDPAMKDKARELQRLLIDKILHRDFYFQVGRYGRVANSITNLKRELRRCLRVDEQPLYSYDISCSQPSLLASLVTRQRTEQANELLRTHSQQSEHCRESTIKEHSIHACGRRGPKQPATHTQRTLLHSKHVCIYDSTFAADGGLQHYVELVETGGLYEYLQAELRDQGIERTRDEIKKRFLCDVLAKRKASKRGAEYPSPIESVFQCSFPAVYRFIRQTNKDGWEHPNLIRQLQRAEADLVIGTVCADLVDRYPGTFFITVHDAIFTTEEHLPKVKEAFQRGFNSMGVRMRIKRGE